MLSGRSLLRAVLLCWALTALVLLSACVSQTPAYRASHPLATLTPSVGLSAANGSCFGFDRAARADAALTTTAKYAELDLAAWVSGQRKYPDTALGPPNSYRWGWAVTPRLAYGPWRLGYVWERMGYRTEFEAGAEPWVKQSGTMTWYEAGAVADRAQVFVGWDGTSMYRWLIRLRSWRDLWIVVRGTGGAGNLGCDGAVGVEWRW